MTPAAFEFTNNMELLHNAVSADANNEKYDDRQHDNAVGDKSVHGCHWQDLEYHIITCVSENDCFYTIPYLKQPIEYLPLVVIVLRYVVLQIIHLRGIGSQCNKKPIFRQPNLGEKSAFFEEFLSDFFLSPTPQTWSGE